MGIEIIDYQTSWPVEFAAAALPVRAALGDQALAIHHVGSTSVPGLCAKDIIDVQVTVADLGPAVAAALRSAGLQQRVAIAGDHPPPGLNIDRSNLEKLLFTEPLGERRANIHVRLDGAFNQQYAVLFRDYLRTHPEARDAYCQVKRALAHRAGDDLDFYYDVKDPAIDMLMVGARIWAQSAGWKQPESDA